MDKWEQKTLFQYKSQHSEEARFANASGGHYYEHITRYDSSPEEIAKIKASIDMDLVNKYFIELVNAERKAAGKAPVTSTSYGREIASLRAQEQADYGAIRTENESGIRPNGTSWITADTQGTASVEYVNDLTDNIYELASEKYIAYDLYYNRFSKSYAMGKDRALGYVYFNESNPSHLSVGIGIAKGSLNNSTTSAFGRNEDSPSAVIVVIAE